MLSVISDVLLENNKSEGLSILFNTIPKVSLNSFIFTKKKLTFSEQCQLTVSDFIRWEYLFD